MGFSHSLVCPDTEILGRLCPRDSTPRFPARVVGKIHEVWGAGRVGEAGWRAGRRGGVVGGGGGALGSARGWHGGGPFGFRTSLGLGDAPNKSTGVGEEEMDLRLFAFSQRHVLPMQASPWLPADASGWSGHRGVAGSTGPSQLSGSFSLSHF